MHPSDRPKAERERGGYKKNPHELISAHEAVLLIDHRVSVLLAHWEDERRKRERARRLHWRVWHWAAMAVALLRPPRPTLPAPTQSEEVVG